jgi:hypothetical protein
MTARLRLTAVCWTLLTLAAAAVALEPPPSPRLVRRISAALGPAQTAELLGGRDPLDIVLADGRSLDELLRAEAAEIDTGLLYTPVDPCILVRTAGSLAGRLVADEVRDFQAHGDLLAQGGRHGGCGVPVEARVLAVSVRTAVAGGEGTLFLWAAGDPQPQTPILELDPGASVVQPALVELCHQGECAAAFAAKAARAATHLRVDVVGYFVPAELTQGPPGEGGRRDPRARADLPVRPARRGRRGPRAHPVPPAPDTNARSPSAPTTAVRCAATVPSGAGAATSARPPTRPDRTRRSAPATATPAPSPRRAPSTAGGSTVTARRLTRSGPTRR